MPTTPREDPESELHELLSAYAQVQPWELRHPLALVRIVLLLARIPVTTCRLSGSSEGQLIGHYLDKSTFGVRHFARMVGFRTRRVRVE